MIKLNESQRQWSEALPRDFEFYHLGKIASASNESPGHLSALFEDRCIIGFHFYGTTRALLAFLFPQELDVSTYSEVGNVLASQVASQLSTQDGLDLLISPPEPLQANQLEKISRGSLPPIHKTYLHIFGDHIIPLEVLLFTFAQETTGYA